MHHFKDESGSGPTIQCLKCEDCIVSESRHDMVWCKCKSIAIDGGDSYTRILGHPEDWMFI